MSRKPTSTVFRENLAGHPEVVFCGLAAGAALHRAWAGAVILAATAVILAGRTLQDLAASTGNLLRPLLAEEQAARLAPSSVREHAETAAASASKFRARGITLDLGPAARKAVGRKTG